LNLNKGYLITYDTNETVKIGDKTIHINRIEEFLLSEEEQRVK